MKRIYVCLLVLFLMVGCNVNEDTVSPESSLPELSHIEEADIEQEEESENNSPSIEDNIPATTDESQDEELDAGLYAAPALEYELAPVDEGFLSAFSGSTIPYEKPDNFIEIDGYVLFHTVQSEWEGPSGIHIQLQDGSVQTLFTSTQSIKRMYLVDSQTIGADLIHTVYPELLASNSYQLNLKETTFEKVDDVFTESAYDASDSDSSWYNAELQDIETVIYNLVFIKDDGSETFIADYVQNMWEDNDKLYYTTLNSETVDSHPDQENTYSIFSLSRQGDVNEVYRVTLTGGFRFFVYGDKIVHTGDGSLWIYDIPASSTIQVNGLTYIYDEPQFFETGFCCYSNSSLYFIGYDGTFERIWKMPNIRSYGLQAVPYTSLTQRELPADATATTLITRPWKLCTCGNVPSCPGTYM